MMDMAVMKIGVDGSRKYGWEALPLDYDGSGMQDGNPANVDIWKTRGSATSTNKHHTAPYRAAALEA